jgi:hypothetical protein
MVETGERNQNRDLGQNQHPSDTGGGPIGNARFDRTSALSHARSAVDFLSPLA